MTPQDQIKAVAELDDEKRIEQLQILFQCRRENIPYLKSLDAIVPVIRKQSNGVILEVENFVEELLGDFYFCKVNPAQLCEALLRATGKWKE